MHEKLAEKSIYLGSVAALAMAYAFTAILDVDILYHLATGREIVNQGGLLQENIFIYTGAGQPFYPNSAWLFELLTFGLYSAFGFSAIILLKCLLAALLFGVCGGILAETGLSRWSRLPVLTVLGWVIAFRLTERPHLFSHLLLAIFVLAVLRYRRGEVRLLYLLPLMMVLWANLHVGFIFGILYLGAVCVAESAMAIWPALRSGSEQTASFDAKSRKQLWRLLLVTTAISFLNPSPLDNYQSVWELVRVGEVYPISEYISPRLMEESAFYFFTAVVLFLLCLRRFRRQSMADLLPAAGFLVLAFSSVRFIPDFAIVALPLVGVCLAGWPLPGRLRFMINQPSATALLVVGSLVAAFLLSPAPFLRQWPVPPPTDMVQGATRFLAEVKARGNLYNSMGVCGSAMLELYPEYPLYQTTYVQVEMATVGEAYRASKDPASWERFLGDRAIQIAWIDTVREPHDPRYYPRRTWALVYFDEQNAIYLRRNARNEAIINKYEFIVADPAAIFAADGSVNVPVDLAAEGEAEIRRVLRFNPESSELNLLLGMFLQVQPGRQKEALAAFNRAEQSAAPSRPSASHILPTILLRQAEMQLALGDAAVAVKTLERARSVSLKDPVVVERLAAALAVAGERRKSVLMLEKAIIDMPAAAGLHHQLGVQSRDAGDLDKAVQSLREAARLSPEDPMILNDLGVALGMQGRLDEALGVFEQILRRDPHNQQALQNRAYAQQLLGER